MDGEYHPQALYGFNAEGLVLGVEVITDDVHDHLGLIHQLVLLEQGEELTQRDVAELPQHTRLREQQRYGRVDEVQELQSTGVASHCWEGFNYGTYDEADLRILLRQDV